ITGGEAERPNVFGSLRNPGNAPSPSAMPWRRARAKQRSRAHSKPRCWDEFLWRSGVLVGGLRPRGDMTRSEFRHVSPRPDEIGDGHGDDLGRGAQIAKAQ